MNQEDTSALRWLVVTIRRAGYQVVSHYLQQAHREELIDPLEREVVGTRPDTVDEILSIREALGRLPLKERRVLLLDTVLDVPQARIAEILGVSQARVSQLRHQALLHMRQSLKEDNPYD